MALSVSFFPTGFRSDHHAHDGEGSLEQIDQIPKFLQNNDSPGISTYRNACPKKMQKSNIMSFSMLPLTSIYTVEGGKKIMSFLKMTPTTLLRTFQL